MLAIDKAREAGVPIITGRSDYRCPCPKCSPLRRKRKDPCLHVEIGAGEVRWYCHHCHEFFGFATDDTGARRSPPDRRSPRSQRRWW